VRSLDTSPSPVMPYAPPLPRAAVHGSALLVLEPPYRATSALRSGDQARELPLGSVVVGVGGSTLAALAALTRLSRQCPWAVPCIVLPPEEQLLEPLLRLVSELRGRLVVVTSVSSARSRIAQVVASVRRREPPTPARLARWLARRLRQRELEAPLRSQFQEALAGIPAEAGLSVATYSRLFSRYGRYCARDWRALALLCVHHATGVDQAPVGTGLPLRTARQYALKYLGETYQVMTGRLGWEWVLEAALRTGRYT